MQTSNPYRANIRSVHGVDYLGSRHPIIKTLHTHIPPNFFGSKLWHSSMMLMRYLEENPLSASTRIIEVGCGWGLLGIYCAKTFKCPVLLTDKEKRVFPYTKAHIALNSVEAETAVLDFRDFKTQHFENRDLMIGSDICFWPELAGTMKKLVGTALDSGVQTIIIADPGRHPFMQLARHCKEHYLCQLLPRHLTNRKGDGYLLIIKNREKTLAAA